MLPLFFLSKMSLNPQAEGKNLYDVLEGSVTSYFGRLAGVLQRNESINGEYQTTVSACYGGNTPVALPNFTRVCISTNGATVVDLANSYITLELEYTLQLKNTMPPLVTGKVSAGARVFFVGFKNSLEALSRYDIYVNNNKLYSQSWVGQESFIYNAGISETMRERAPYVYTSWKNASQMSHDVCGVYIKFDNAELLEFNHEIKVTIPVKINLHQILMLASVRYLPSFCGRWEIELYPSAQNLVILPIPLETTKPVEAVADEQTKDFTQLGKVFYHYKGYDETGTAYYTREASPMTIISPAAILQKCLMNTTTFKLRYEVYEGLRQMYAEQPLIIPTNILTYGRFSGEPSGGTDFHATLSQCLENCDSVFILVPFENGQHTCFYQPYLKEMRLSLGEFGVRPSRSVQTWNDPRFLAMCLDALNLETSEITAMNEDVARSLNPETRAYHFVTKDGKSVEEDWLRSVEKGDKSNFFIGISLSQVGFQSGTVSSPNTNVPFIFDAVVDRTTGSPHEKVPQITTSIIVMFLIDCALMIQVVQDSDIPIVKLTSKSIV
jgi:hypothetical protein